MDETSSPTAPLSPALLEANERLMALRQSLGIAASPPFVPDAPVEDREPATPEPPASLPDHLGWGSEAITRAIRRALGGEAGTAAAPHLPIPWDDSAWSSVPMPPDNPSPRGLAQATLKLYPTLALALLKQEQVACGRVWLLLRYLDAAGRGWVAPDEVRRVLTTPDSSLYLFGERQLRKLLAQGDGLFWQRDEGHIWLVGLARVAAAVGVEKLAGKPVALPLAVLLGPIGDVRTHLYANFHSSRTKTERPAPRVRPSAGRH